MKENKVSTKEKNIRAILHFRPLFFFFLLLLAGVIFVRRAFVGEVLYIILTISIFIIVLLYSIHRRNAFIFVFCAFAFALGGGLYCLSLLSYNSQPNFNSTVSVVGRVKDDISYYENKVCLTLDNVKIDGENVSNVYLSISGDADELKVGDTLVFETKPVKEPLFNFGSFRNNYVRDNVVYYASVNIGNVKIFEGKLKFDEQIRKTIKNTLFSSMSEENAYVAYAVLTGEKSGIESDIYNNYKQSGMLHILTVSGLHVGVFASCIAFLLKKIKAKRWLNFLITAVILFFYCYICGFAPSVIRATVMSLVLILSVLSGKEYDFLSSIGFAGIILLFINPLYAFDAGFLMSFFCVIFIALLHKPFTRFLNKFLPNRISQLLAITLCTMVGTLPFLASFYGNFNFLSLFANFFAVPFFSIVFILFLAFVLISTILPFMNFLLVVVDGAFYVLNIIAGFYSNNILSIPLSPLYEPISFLIFLLSLCLSDFVMLKSKIRIVATCVLSCVLIACCALSFVPNLSKETEIYYLNSYSTSVFIKSKSGKSMLIDLENKMSNSKFFDFMRYKNVDYHLSFKKPNEKYTEFLKSREVKSSLYFDTTQKSTDSSAIRKGNANKIYSYGDFEYCFYENEGNYLGIEVKFDNISIFFAKSENLSYNDIVKLKFSIEKVDLLFANSNLQFLDAIKCDKSFAVFANKNTNYYYSGFGDMKITKNEIISVRSIG